MMYIDISEKQFKKMLDDYLSEIDKTTTIEKLVMKVLKELTYYSDVDWHKIKIFVDKQIHDEEQSEL